jgi:triosephosphate isomerase
VIIAYEPVWAIGEHGTPATVDQVAGVMALINEVVTTVDGSARSILYGGSVTARNASELLSDPNIHGLFIGRAAWEASSFINILKLCSVIDGMGAGQPTLEVP